MDLLGYGSNAPNVTTSRPSDTRVFSSVDTWGKDCSTPTANDGTGVQAGFVNGMLAQFRNAIRGNGQTAALAPVVPEDNTNDAMLLQAFQQLIQRGQSRFAVDSGAADNLVVAFSPAMKEYKAGTSIKVLVAANSTGAAGVINCNGLGSRSILRLGAKPLQPNDMPAGAIITLDDDGTRFQITSVTPNLSHAAAIVTASTTLNLTLIQRSIALLRTSSPAAMTINLPAGAENAHEVEIEDVADNLQAFPATIVPPAGETIVTAANYKMDRNLQSTRFRLYDNGTTRIWSRST